MVDEYLMERINRIMKDLKVPWSEKKMFGGNCIMVDDKMCFGTFKGGLMARVDPEKIPELLQQPATVQMTMGGKMMKGYLIIEPKGYDRDEDLEFWIRECLDFNPKAQASKKR